MCMLIEIITQNTQSLLTTGAGSVTLSSSKSLKLSILAAEV